MKRYRFWGFAFLIFMCLAFSWAFQHKNETILVSKTEIKLESSKVWATISENNQLSSKYEYLKNLTFFKITYKSDNRLINGLLIEPNLDGVFPAIIFNRGGNRDFAPLTIQTLINYTGKVAASGFVVIASNYRADEEFGGQDINDVLNLFDVLEETPKAKANCVGMFGWSRGGIMTYLALAKTNKIKTAVVGNGPSDLLEVANTRPVLETRVLAECIPNYWENKEEKLKKRSAIYWPEKLSKNSSLLILSGLNDNRQNPLQAKKMAQKLDSLNYNFKIMEVETDHFFSDQKPLLEQTLVDWFAKNLSNCN